LSMELSIVDLASGALVVDLRAGGLRVH
jgi:hypothetical protein